LAGAASSGGFRFHAIWGAFAVMVKISDLISFTFSWPNIDQPFEMIGFVAASMVSISVVVHGLVSKII